MSEKKKPKPAKKRARGMIPFSVPVFAGLKALAKRNKRPLSWEADLMARQYLAENGLPIPDEERPG